MLNTGITQTFVKIYGATGHPGMTGTTGNTGCTGPAGLQGLQGNLGPQGVTGRMWNFVELFRKATGRVPRTRRSVRITQN